MGKIMNKDNQSHQMVETEVEEGSVEKVSHNEIVEAMQKMKPGKATGPSEEDDSCKWPNWIKVMINLCQHKHNRRGICVISACC